MRKKGTGIRLGWLAGVLLLGILCREVTAFGAERAVRKTLPGRYKTEQGKGLPAGTGSIAVEELPGSDWSEIDLFLQQQDGWETEGFRFSELVKALMEGDKKAVGERLMAGLRQSLIAEVSHGIHLAGELLALGLVGAVFANFSHIFTGSQISETAFFYDLSPGFYRTGGGIFG